MKPNRVMIIHSIFHTSNSSSNKEWYPPFNEETIKTIEERKTIAVIDAAVKNGQKSRSWIISDIEWKSTIKN